MDRNELQKIIAGIIDETRSRADLAAEIIADIVVNGIDYNEIADYLAMYQPSEICVQQLIFEKVEGEYVNDTTETAFDAWIEQHDRSASSKQEKVECCCGETDSSWQVCKFHGLLARAKPFDVEIIENPDGAANDKKDAWHKAVLHECMMTESCYVVNDPLQSVKNLIDWHVANEKVWQQPDSAAVEPIGFIDSTDDDVTGGNYFVEFYPDRYLKLGAKVYLHPPTKHQRITEQNATDVYISAVEHFNYTKSFHPAAWLHMQGRTLLAKLNENREPDYKAIADDLAETGKAFLSVWDDVYPDIESGKYPQEALEHFEFNQANRFRAAIAKHEGAEK